MLMAEAKPPQCHVITFKPHRREEIHSNMIQYVRTDFINGKPDGCQTLCLTQWRSSQAKLSHCCIIFLMQCNLQSHCFCIQLPSPFSAHCGVLHLYMQRTPSHCVALLSSFCSIWCISSNMRISPPCPSPDFISVWSRFYIKRCQWWAVLRIGCRRNKCMLHIDGERCQCCK